MTKVVVLLDIGYMIIWGILLAVIMLFNPSSVFAAYGINRTINFQGKLVTPTGVNVPNSTPVTVTFSIYQTNSSCPGGGSAVWSENQTFTPVDGIFQVALGSSTAFASSIDFSQDTLYLGIKVSTETNEMCMGSSRIKLAAVPYAFNAEKFAGMSGDNSQTNYFTVTGGQSTPATLKVDGNITVGSIITPTTAGGLTVRSNGANTMTIDTGTAAALNIGATSNAITIGTATNSNGLTLNSGTGDITLLSTDDISINGGGASAVIDIGTAAVSQAITLGNSTGGALRLGQNGGTVQIDGTNFDVGTTGLVTLIGGLATDITTQSNNNLTIKPGGTGVLGMSTTDGSISLNAGGVSNGDITLNSTDDITLDGSAGSLVNIGTSAVTQTVKIGATINTDLVLQDTDWGITGAGAATFTALNLGTGSFASCDFLGSNSSGDVTCSTNGFNVVAAQNTNNVTWVDNDTTDLWVTLPNLQITVSSGSEVLVMASFASTSVDPVNQNESLGARIDREGAGVASDCADINTVGVPWSGSYTDNANGDPATAISGSVAFVDTGTSAGGTFTYEVCSESTTTTIGGGTWVLDTMELTLIEVNNTGDLAEIYPTNDTSLQMAEVVSIDPTLEGGILRSVKAYDKNLLGVVTSKPALVIGGRNGLGVDGKPVALTGRVPVKVSNVNGKIKTGDPLTSSNIPGVAMKATKTGPILGIAMRDYEGSGIGTVLTYIKTGYYTGGNLAEIVKDVAPEQAQQTILSHFMAEKQQYTPMADLSELVADRIVAGLEIITPTVYADQIFAESILAGKIKVRQIEGIENLIASESAKLVNNDGLEMLSVKYMALEQKMASISGLLASTPIPTLVMPSPILSPTPTLDMKVLGQLLATQGLTVSGPAVFGDSVEFIKPPKFSEDTAGYGVIQKDTQWVDIVFNNEYSSLPIVIIDSANYVISNKTIKGFRVESRKPAEEDLRFTWMAIAVNNPRTFMSILPTPTPIPTLIPTLIPTPTVTEATSSADPGP